MSVMQEDYEEVDYTLIGRDLTGLWLQPGFVEGVIADRKSFATLEEAYRHIFRRNLEYLIMLWNGIPVRFSYTDDIPAMAGALTRMLQSVWQSEAGPETSHRFMTPGIETEWKVETDSGSITIKGVWQQTPGNYEAALNHLGIIRMTRVAFLCEWKLLLQQLIKAVDDAEAVLTTPEARDQLKVLQSIEPAIPARGRFYQYGPGAHTP